MVWLPHRKSSKRGRGLGLHPSAGARGAGGGRQVQPYLEDCHKLSSCIPTKKRKVLLPRGPWVLLMTAGTVSGSPWVPEELFRQQEASVKTPPETCVSWPACCRAGTLHLMGRPPQHAQLSDADR